MVDFKAQLEKGLNAHRQATAAIDEVNLVLRNLSDQVSEYTNGRVGIALKQELGMFLADSAASISALTSGMPVTPPLQTQHILVAYDKSRGLGKAQRLASWTQHKSGYPCILRFDDAKREAVDRKSLEETIGVLLASSETGRVISSIASTPPKPEAIDE